MRKQNQITAQWLIWTLTYVWMSPLAYGAEVPARTPQAPQQEQPAAQQDNAQKNDSSAAMAAFGAAMAGASCAMLMRQAMKTTDPAMKSLLMSQAMQQCSQAAQSAASAGKNKDNRDLLSLGDFKSNTAPQAFEMPKETTTPAPTTPDLQLPTESDTDPLADITPRAPSDTGARDTVASGSDIQVDSEALKPIASNKLGYDESAGSAAGGATGAGGLTGAMAAASMGGAGNGTNDLGKKLDPLEPSTTPKNGRDNRKDNGEPSDGSPGSDEAKQGESLESMMANIFGGGQKDTMDLSSFGGGGGSDILSLGKPGSKDAQANIFEFASFRYKKAAYDEGKLQVRSPGARRATASATDAFLAATY